MPVPSTTPARAAQLCGSRRAPPAPLIRSLPAALLLAFPAPCLAAGAAQHAEPPAAGPATLAQSASARDAQANGAPAVDAAARVFVEVLAERDSGYVHEPLRLRLRLGVEREFLRTGLLQLFHRQLDVPVQLRVPWIDGLPGAIGLPEAGAAQTAGAAGTAGAAHAAGAPPAVAAPGAPATAQRPTLALNEEVVAATRAGERVIEGRTFIVFELERSLLPRFAGELQIPGPAAHFAYATRFEQGFLDGRVALDRREQTVRGAPLALRVLPLPAQGCPLEFAGAVGSFELHAQASPRELAVGESLRLTLRVEGRGNLGFFEPPRLPPLDGLRVLGSVQHVDALGLTAAWDLVALAAGAREIPPVRFAFFDPRPAAWRTLASEPIALDVRPRPAEPGEASASGAERAPAVPGPAEAATRGGARSRAREPQELAQPLWTFAVGGVLGLALLLLLLLLWQRIARSRERERAQARLRAAATAFHARLEDPDADLSETFTAFLAARLGCAPVAVAGTGLAGRLVAAGTPVEASRQAAALLGALLEARYGGAPPPDGAAQASALVDLLSGGRPPPEAS